MVAAPHVLEIAIMKPSELKTIASVVGKLVREQLARRDERLKAMCAEVEVLRKRLDALERNTR